MIGLSAGTIKATSWTPPDTTTLPVVSLSVLDSQAMVGGPDYALVYISRTSTTAGALTVNYSLGGTATPGSAYRLLGDSTMPTSAVIPIGQAGVILTIQAEAVGSATFNLTSSELYTVSQNASGTVLLTAAPIVLPTVTLTSSDTTAVSSTGNPANLTFTRTGSTAAALVIGFTLSGSAVAGTDYCEQGQASMPTSVTIPIGQTSVAITVVAKSHDAATETKTATVTLTSNSGYNLSSPSVSLSITTSTTFTIVSTTAQAVPRTITTASVDSTLFDMQIRSVYSDRTFYDHQLTANYSGVLSDSFSWSSSNPTVATVNSSGFVTHLTTGTANITVAAQGQSRTISLSLVAVGSIDPTVSLIGYAAGSLSEHVNAQVNSRLVGKTPSTSKPIYSTRDGTNHIYVRNTAGWAYSVDLTCISPFSWHGALVSPRHIHSANHAAPSGQIRFVTTDNQVITRTIVATYNPGADSRISLLDSDVPSSIKFAKVLPNNFLNYMPDVDFRRVAALCTDQEDKALVFDTSLGRAYSWTTFFWPVDSVRATFNETAIGGDSSSPLFLIINGELVFLASWLSSNFVVGEGTIARGTSIDSQRNLINTWMASNSPYQLTDVDLSSFPTFSA